MQRWVTGIPSSTGWWSDSAEAASLIRHPQVVVIPARLPTHYNGETDARIKKPPGDSSRGGFKYNFRGPPDEAGKSARSRAGGAQLSGEIV